jgi:hypothetical protein
MSESEYLKRPDAQGHLRVMEVLRRWDPIGVFTIDPNWSSDEYDSYSPQIVRMLDGGCTAGELAQHLAWIQTDRMAITPDKKRDLEIASELVEWWKRWKDA